MSDFTAEIERETDGRWIGEVTALPVCSRTALIATKLSQGQRLSHFACSPIGSSTEK